MDHLIFKKLWNVFEEIKIADYAPDRDIFGQQILNTISESFHIDKSFFVVQDEGTGLLHWIKRNIRGKWIAYYEDYYYFLDPIKMITVHNCEYRLIPHPHHRKSVVRLQELIDYPSFQTSEYYNDFLKKQGIYYEMTTYLKSRDKVLGIIELFRSKGSRDFYEEEVEIMRVLSPYIVLVLENIDLRHKAALESTMLETIEGQCPDGLIIYDESMKVVYMNQEAREYCEILNGNPSPSRKTPPPVPPALVEDCVTMREEANRFSDIIPALPKYRMIRSNGRRYSVRSQLFKHNLRRFFMVYIGQVGDPRIFNKNRVQRLFSLSPRETEIVIQIFGGLRNSEIAEKLFISEITVKKHIQHICEKIGVNNRTAIIHEVLKGLNVI
jgi:DNA-binding CsgD family transcriptional regulator